MSQTFYWWCIRNREFVESRVSCADDFMGDMLNDSKFPRCRDYASMFRHLNRKDACAGALEAFIGMYRLYADEHLKDAAKDGPCTAPQYDCQDSGPVVGDEQQPCDMCRAAVAEEVNLYQESN
ncbi:hypothetical protein [Streptomyces sp. NPDC059166]|uniref:hypothetical protein n=1 Tax=Streptomyces sp. NPDC059166 TaxID=3346752 RepID=UPI003675B7C9